MYYITSYQPVQPDNQLSSDKYLLTFMRMSIGKSRSPFFITGINIPVQTKHGRDFFYSKIVVYSQVLNSLKLHVSVSSNLIDKL